jgi:hypothetical protein
MGYGAATFYLFTSAIQCGTLGAMLTFARSVWYPIYTHTMQIWALTLLQQLAGLIMWIPAGIVYLAAGLALFAAWLSSSATRARRRSDRIWQPFRSIGPRCWCKLFDPRKLDAAKPTGRGADGFAAGAASSRF